MKPERSHELARYAVIAVLAIEQRALVCTKELSYPRGVELLLKINEHLHKSSPVTTLPPYFGALGRMLVFVRAISVVAAMLEAIDGGGKFEQRPYACANVVVLCFC